MPPPGLSPSSPHLLHLLQGRHRHRYAHNGSHQYFRLWPDPPKVADEPGWYGFDSDSRHKGFTIGDAAFYATSIICQVKPTIIAMAQDIMDVRTCCMRCSKACTNFYGFGRRNTHHSHSQTSAQASIPLTEAAQADWYVEGDHLKNTAAGIPVLLGFQDTCNHFLSQCFIGAAHRRSLYTSPHGIWVGITSHRAREIIANLDY